MGRDIFNVISMALHVVALFFLFAIVSDYHFIDPGVLSTIRASNHPDIVETASQMGRFDLVSLLLTVLGLMMGLAGIFGFGYFRGQSYAIARATAEQTTEERLTGLLGEITRYMEQARSFENMVERPATAPPVPQGLEKAGVASETTDLTG